MWVKRILKWIGLVLLGIIALVVMAVVLVYIVMGRDLARTYDIEGEFVNVPSDAASIEAKISNSSCEPEKPWAGANWD